MIDRKKSPEASRKISVKSPRKIKQKPDLKLVDVVKELTLVSNKLNAQVNGLRLAVLKIARKMEEN